KQFTLTHDDINKNIQDITDNIRYPTLIENIREVIATGQILEKEVQTTDKRWFQMNILPYYVRKENRTNGVRFSQTFGSALLCVRYFSFSKTIRKHKI